MKLLVFGISVAAVVFGTIGFIVASEHLFEKHEIAWLGAPVTKIEDKQRGGHWDSALLSVEIGLRDDGVVVWRKMPE